jgi:hypothetical protein
VTTLHAIQLLVSDTLGIGWHVRFRAGAETGEYDEVVRCSRVKAIGKETFLQFEPLTEEPQSREEESAGDLTLWIVCLTCLIVISSIVSISTIHFLQKAIKNDST